MKTFIYILILFLAGGLNAYAQMQRSSHVTGVKGELLVFPRGIQNSSGEVSYLIAADNGNSFGLVPLFREPVYHNTPAVVIQNKPFLQIHGNVMYDLYYQSGVDTPYQQKDVYQHTLTTYLDITVKDQYPVRVGFSTTRGNSAMFRNITGLNLQYTNRDFKSMLLNKLQNYDVARNAQLNDLKLDKLQLDNKAMEINRLKGWLSSSAQLQKLVEARERKVYGIPSYSPPLPSVDSLPLIMRWKGASPDKRLPVDTGNFEDKYAARARQLDSLQHQWDKMDQRYREQQKKYGAGKDDLVSTVMSSRNNKELADKLHAMDLPDSAEQW